MPETPTAAALEIPAASIAAWCEGPDINCGNDEHDIRAIAAPVVAAELRRIANLAEPESPLRPPSDWDAGYLTACDQIAEQLRARADELDPPARQED